MSNHFSNQDSFDDYEDTYPRIPRKRNWIDANSCEGCSRKLQGEDLRPVHVNEMDQRLCDRCYTKELRAEAEAAIYEAELEFSYAPIAA